MTLLRLLVPLLPLAGAAVLGPVPAAPPVAPARVLPGPVGPSAPVHAANLGHPADPSPGRVPGRAPGGPWVAPVAPLQPVRTFDPPRVRWGSGHRGVDLRAPSSTPVRAAGAGRVAFAGVVAGRPVVSVDHGGLRTTYEPVRASVRAGEPVSPGQALGTVAGDSHCPGGCLHWGLRQGETYLDPLHLLSPPEVVLRPLAR